MPQPATSNRYQLVTTPPDQANSFARDVAEGLTGKSKRLPCHWFYDDAGSELFEEICDLPEYYLTRCERSILAKHADDIAARFAAPTTLVELGSGSASKTRLIIEAFLKRHGHVEFAPIDISQSMLEQSAQLLLADYPRLHIRAFAGHYQSGLSHLAHQRQSAPPEGRPAAPQLTLWLGSSVGNLHRKEASEFLGKIRTGMTPDDRLLIGVDLRKDGKILERAYDDSRGVTARFDLNLLVRINEELGGRFDLERFEHKAIWRPDPGRVESHLVSRDTQTVRIDDLDLEIDLYAGESIHTENSYKYSPAEIDWLAGSSDMSCENRWRDPEGLYSLNLFAPVERALR